MCSLAEKPVEAIPPQLLADALDEFALVTMLQVIYPAQYAKGIQSPGSKGGTPDETLRELLAGTGLEYHWVNKRTVTVQEPQRPASSRSTLQDSAAEALTKQELLAASAVARRPGASPHQVDGIGHVTITGSHISGHAPVGARPVIITRKEIEQTGFATVQDVIRTLPQNFSGGPSEDTYAGLGGGVESLFNTSRGTGINLRGLGAGSTLVLLNGRRLSPGAAEGRFVDVSGLPLSAVERIEVLPDGASAIYGADAVGGVVNVILRDDYAGLETTARWGASTGGGAAESQASAVLGQDWLGGNGLLSLEYYHRDALPSAERHQSAFSDLRPFGGSNWDVAEGSPATIVSAGQTWAIPPGQDGRSLRAEDLVAGTVNLHNRNEGLDLLPAHERWSVVGTARQSVSETMEFFADGLLSRRRTTARNPALRQLIAIPETHPFYVRPSGSTGPIIVAYGFGDDFGSQEDVAQVTSSSLTLGATIDVAANWAATGYVGYADYADDIHLRSLVNQSALAAALADPDPLTVFNPFGDGSHTNPSTLDAIRDDVFLARGLAHQTASLSAEGVLIDWSGRQAKLAVGAEYRLQSLDSRLQQSGAAIVRDLHRDASAAYAELLVPLVDATNRKQGIARALLSLAMRHEHYSDFGGATMPRIGFEWAPREGLSLLGTWSRSFKAPNLVDLNEAANSWSIDTQSDPNSPSGPVPVLLWFGNNANLREETARTWTLGAEFTLPEYGAQFGLTYFHIRHSDRAERITYSSSFLGDPTLAALVTRDPTAAQREAVCASNTPLGDAAAEACRSAPIAAIVDMRLRNVAVVRAEGIDLTAAWRRETHLGAFDVGLDATYLLDFARARFDGSPMMTLLDTPGNPLDFRLRGSLSWRLRQFGASAFLNYADSYHDAMSLSSVGAWATLDMQLRYGREAGSGFSLNVQNVFDEPPPFLNNPAGIGYDLENGDILGRFASIELRWQW